MTTMTTMTTTMMGGTSQPRLPQTWPCWSVRLVNFLEKELW